MAHPAGATLDRASLLRAPHAGATVHLQLPQRRFLRGVFTDLPGAAGLLFQGALVSQLPGSAEARPPSPIHPYTHPLLARLTPLCLQAMHYPAG